MEGKSNNILKRLEGDKVIMIIVLLLLLISFLAIFSSTPLLPAQEDRLATMTAHGMVAALGIGLMIGLYYIPINWLRTIGKIGFIGSFGMLAMLLMKINIPGMFYAYNDQKRFRNVKPARYEGLTKDAGKASDCIGCGQCTAVCPQRLVIPDLLDDVAATFEK